MFGLYKLLLVILVLPAHWIAESKIEMVLSKIECKNFMPSLITNLTCVVKSNHLDQQGVHMNFLLAKDTYNVSASFSVKVRREKLTMNYMNIHMDFDAGLNAPLNHIASRIVAYGLRQSSNIPFGRPFEKNKHYFVRDFRVNADLLPKYTPEVNFTSTGDIYTNQVKAMRIIVSGCVLKLRETINEG